MTSALTDLKMKALNTMHRTVLKVSGGKVGWKAGGMPVLELHTTGRKSGQERSVMLTSPIQDGDTWTLVASKGGNDAHPAWYLNLEAQPEVEATIKGKRRPMTARILSSEEKAEVWPRITASYKGYAGYQSKTDRDIPVVVLEPRSGS